MKKRGVKTVRPSPTYSIEVPADVREDYEDGVSSFWRPGEPLLVQVSSYLRTTGEQISASERLRDRITKSEGHFGLRRDKIHIGPTVVEAAAETTDQSGVHWLHAYFVWPHLAVYATVSGPLATVQDSNNWAVRSLKTLKPTVQ